jgi:hypothetical protein
MDFIFQAATNFIKNWNVGIQIFNLLRFHFISLFFGLVLSDSVMLNKLHGLDPVVVPHVLVS